MTEGDELGRDSLGGCAYKTVREFYTAHRDPNPMHRNSFEYREKHGNSVICHYFPSMVREACTAARKTLQRYQSMRVRHA